MYRGRTERCCCLALLSSLLAVLASAAHAASDAQWQAAYVEQNVAVIDGGTGRPDGFKAGLSSLVARQRFHSDRSVYGVLPAGSQLSSGRVSLGGLAKPMIEMELAFRLGERRQQPFASDDELKASVSLVALALEIPDLQRIPAPLSALNIVRGNVAARYFVVSEGQPVSEVALDTLRLSLWKDEKRLLSTAAEGLAEPQWSALRSLLNQRMAMGWEIAADQWLLTGALGGMQPLERGEYRLVAKGFPALSLRVEEP